MVGEQVAATQDNRNQNRVYPVLNDYRSLIGGLVGRSFDLTSKQLQAIFPGVGAAEASLV